MWRASEEFGFERVDFDDGDDTLGIWDGSKFVLTVRLAFSACCASPNSCPDWAEQAGWLVGYYQGHLAIWLQSSNQDQIYVSTPL